MTEAVAEHQRLVREVGKKLEANVWRILNDTLNKKRIYAFNVADIRRWTGRNHSMKRLIDYVKVSINNACWQDQTTTLPDTDNLVVYKQDDAGADLINWHPLAIISCKTSFHARETESLFWALQVRPKKIPYVLVMRTLTGTISNRQDAIQSLARAKREIESALWLRVS